MTQSLLRLAADFSRQLAASVSIGATTATLNAYTDSDGVALQNNVLYGFTIDKGANKEYIVATHLNGALSGVMNITRQGVASSGFAKAHRIGAPVEITDWAILSRIVNLLNGTTDLDSGTPLKYDGAPSQAQANALATVQFVLDTASGSTVLAFNPLTIDGVAGENITDGDWIYFKESDGQWYKVDADSSASSVGVKIGKARGTALAEAGIPGGIFVYGVETEGTYTTGQAYYISNTAGQLSTTPGTNSVKIGVGDDNEDLVMTYVNPSELTPGTIDALAGGGDLGTPSSTNKFLTQNYNSSATGLPVVRTYVNADSPATWTKPSGLKYVVVEVQAGGADGGGGGGNANDRGSGGGAGGYSKKLIAAASLGATETVTIGAAAGNSSFGSHATANGGTAGTNGTAGIILGGAGGTAASGDVNVTGNYGYNAVTYDAAGYISGRGASSKFGSGGLEKTSAGAGNNATGYGAGGGGGWGSSGNPVAAGSGTPGIVIVTEYYS